MVCIRIKNDEPHDLDNNYHHTFLSFENLNRLPTVLCLLCVSGLYWCTFLTMQLYVITYQHSVLLFGVGSLLTFCSYFVMNFYLEKYSDSYNSIPNDRRFYVLSNLIKSALLLIYTPHAIQMLKVLNYLPEVLVPTRLPFELYGTGDSYTNFAISQQESFVTTIHNMSALYAIPDFVSMLLVPNMAWSTRIHHIVVVLFVAVIFTQSFDYPSVWIGVVVYGIYSSFSYLVNFLLASRFLPVTKVTEALLQSGSLVIYSICCVLNWTWQAYFAINLVWSQEYRDWYWWKFEIVIYIMLLSAFIYDDLILLKWLKFKTSQSYKSYLEKKE